MKGTEPPFDEKVDAARKRRWKPFFAEFVKFVVAFALILALALVALDVAAGMVRH